MLDLLADLVLQALLQAMVAFIAAALQMPEDPLPVEDIPQRATVLRQRRQLKRQRPIRAKRSWTRPR